MPRQARLLTAEEIAQELRMNVDVVRRKLRRGEIPAQKIGKLWRTDEREFRAWLRVGRRVPMAEAKIVTDPEVAFGKPVIAGTRIAVELILEELASGESLDDILENHPHVTREQVVAALEYAKRAVRASQASQEPDEESQAHA